MWSGDLEAPDEQSHEVQGWGKLLGWEVHEQSGITEVRLVYGHTTAIR